MASSGAGKRAALLVGADRYEDPEILDLACAMGDCRESYAFLKHAAQYDPVQLLRESASEEALDAAVKMVGELGEGDLFLFYFARNQKGRMMGSLSARTARAVDWRPGDEKIRGSRGGE